jgi:hypothetical protein
MELSDNEKTALIRELRHIIDDDKFPLSSGVMTLKAILERQANCLIAS